MERHERYTQHRFRPFPGAKRMTPKQRTYAKAGLIVGVLLLLWWLTRKPQTVQQAMQMSPWSAPFFQTNPGINDGSTWGGAQFQANNTLNYYDGNIKGLSNQYIPMFGLVGMTAVSA
jgi:hypothetical protein